MKELEWIELEDVIKEIQQMVGNNWSWIYNDRCKYFNLRIDTRDYACYLTDREGKYITLEELKKQEPK